MKKEKKNSKPQLSLPFLRFKGFDEGWIETSLSEISTLKKGKNLKKSHLNVNGVNKCILYGQLFTIYKSTIYEVFSKTNYFGYSSKINSLLFPTSSTSKNDYFPCSSLNVENVQIGSDVAIFEIDKKNDANYISYLFSKTSSLKKLYNLSEGSSINHLYGDAISNFLFYKSKYLKEQNKIAKFLSLLDKQISLWERKLELSLLFFKYYLYKLIPNSNYDNLLRFKKYCHLTNFYSNKKYSEIFTEKSSKKFIAKNLIPNFENSNQCVKVYEQGEDNGKYSLDDNYLDLKNESLILFGDHTRNIKYIEGRALFSGDGIKLLDTKNNKYYFYVLKRKKIKSLGYSRHFKIIKNSNFYIHCVENEQNDISLFLRKISDYHKKINEKVIKVKEFKKYYMNNLFI